MPFRDRQLVIVVADLARFTVAVAGLDAVTIATIIDRFYRDAAEVIVAAGGSVVKYLGDACLATFPPERAADALGAVEAIGIRVDALAMERGLSIQAGANVHLATVAEGEFGLDGAYDVVGAGVIHTFRMGGGPGIRISEPVYRSLPSGARAGWHKRQPPATYTRLT